MKKSDRLTNLIFSVLVLAGLLAGLAVALTGRIDVNEYENRYAEKFAAFTFEGYFSGDFQDTVEAALGDQLPAATIVKERYNLLQAAYSDKVLKLAVGTSYTDDPAEEELSEEEQAALEAELAAAEGERAELLRQRIAAEARGVRKGVTLDPEFKYIWTSSGMGIAYDHLLYKCRFLEGEQTKLDARIENLNSLISTYTGPEYYLYYIEKETDVNFETGERSGIYEYISANVALPDDHKACYMLDSFAQLHSYYYHADHHWNYRGSYAAYKKILTWMLPDEEPLVPLTSWDVGTFSGSKATGDLSNYSDTMTVYEFEFPEQELTINGAATGDYGCQVGYINSAKEGKSVSGCNYGNTYGWDNGEVVVKNAAGNGETILIFGDSFDNALVKLLGSHFSTLVTIDLRNYQAQMGKSFNYQNYLDEYSPDKVLFIGNLDFYVLSTFNIK